MCDTCHISKDTARAQLEIIDNTLVAIGIPIRKKVKAFKFPYEASFLELLLTEWARSTTGAVKKGLKIIGLGSGVVSERQAETVLKKIKDHINKVFPEGVGKELSGLMTKSYKKARDPIWKRRNFDIKWDQADNEAVDWLTDHHMYWIGNYYDKHVSAEIATVIADGMREGLSRKDIGDSLTSFFDDYPGVANKPESYWRGMAANGMNRSRNFGLIHGYEEVDITTLVVLAVMDERTSAICREMNGREIPVVSAVRQRDAMMEAHNPEDIKQISKWPKLGDISGKKTSEILGQNVIMPPYHFHCRTTVVEK